MKNATMLYKAPGPHDIHGGHFDHIIVDADEEGAIEQAQENGWFLTTPEAKAAYDATKAPEVKLPPNDLLGPTRAELEQKANELKKALEFYREHRADYRNVADAPNIE